MNGVWWDCRRSHAKMPRPAVKCPHGSARDRNLRRNRLRGAAARRHRLGTPAAGLRPPRRTRAARGPGRARRSGACRGAALRHRVWRRARGLHRAAACLRRGARARHAVVAAACARRLARSPGGAGGRGHGAGACRCPHGPMLSRLVSLLRRANRSACRSRGGRARSAFPARWGRPMARHRPRDGAAVAAPAGSHPRRRGRNRARCHGPGPRPVAARAAHARRGTGASPWEAAPYYVRDKVALTAEEQAALRQRRVQAP